ncbi:MAG: hypothetical protein ACD_79C00066G0001 [uncultured bacterium]|nr:MAG: hypothetical protein ACD_79C00066G0001 [uncultured bacterium]
MKNTFEWDDNKNLLNIKNHGINFSDGYLIFQSPILKNLDTRNEYSEDRWLGIGTLNNFYVVICWNEKDDGNVIRIISIRKALKHERKAYEKFIYRLG